MLYAILIDGDIENTLGGACSRDVWCLTRKLLTDTDIQKNNIFSFFRDTKDPYASKLIDMKITNIEHSNIINIRKCFDDIVHISHTKPITVFFHYSGHGYQTRDLNGDEIDGFDEIFLNRTMSDDYIWENFITKLSKTTNIFALLDACHSGSGMDFPYLWNNGKWILQKRKNIDAVCNGFSLSACNDTQCSSQDIGNTTGFAGSLIAGVCDCCKLSDIIYSPFQLYKQLVPRLLKLKQNIELYSIHNMPI